MPKCVVFGCDRTSGRHLLEDDGCTPLSFFSLGGIPQNTLRTWLKLCKRTDIPYEKCKHVRICSRHFLASDVLGNRMVKARLRNGAFPSKHLPISKFATSFREASQAQYRNVKVAKNIVCAEDKKSEDFVLATSYPPVFTHPVSEVTSLEPAWNFNKVGEITWYFLVTVTDNSDNVFPEVEKSVRILNDGSKPQFYIGKEMLSDFRSKALMRYKNYKIEAHFIRILDEFGKIPPAETNLLATVLDMINMALDDNGETENSDGMRDCEQLEPSTRNDNDEGAVDMQHVGHEESVICDENVVEVQDNQESDSTDTEVNTVGLRFMMEQLQLYAVPPRNRRWSSFAMKWALAMHTKSAAAYRFMRSSGYLYLPCERTLSRYTVFGTLKPSAAKKEDKCVEIQ